MRVGVLALQGDVAEHAAMLDSVGATAVYVRRAGDLDGIDALVMPGGESTAMLHLLATSGLRQPLGDALEAGLPVLATCAGLILLADKVVDGRADQWSYARLDVGVRRNGYGRQVASFESDVRVAGVGVMHGVFIRAPRIESWGAEVEVMASLDHGDGEHPVLVRQGSIIGASFHPELAHDDRLHRLFVESL
ncbi:MAG: pyridoxal 5'-phosphate synthase glutaminase subunit PdxT [Acidimicrobiales bacterium]